MDEICDTLIENALRHGAGPIRLIVDVDQGTGRLRVTDRGSGIAPEDRDRVTERFERGRDASGEGTGLGLAIARELAERWGGARAFDAADGLATAAVRFRLATRGAR
ncbi:MAG: sensor histidine kinase [Actinomycetota bacterium]